MAGNPAGGKATGRGCKAAISTDGSTYKDFASITKLGPPNMSRGTVDVTDLNSFENNDQMKEVLPDFIEADEMTIEGFVKATDEGKDAAETAFYAGTEVYVKITLPAPINKAMIVQGYIVGYKPIGDITNDAGIAFSMNLKPNKKPKLDPVSA